MTEVLAFWKKFDSNWRTWSRTRRMVTFLVLFALVFAAATGVQLAVKASAEPAVQGICQPGGNPELQCLTNHQLVKKFHNGKLGRRAAFVPADYFTNPRQFRHMAHSKIVTYLRNHPKFEGKMRVKFLTKDPGCTDYCLAWKLYDDLMSRSNCGPAVPINTDPNTCKGFESGSRKAGARAITIVVCGGGIALGALGVFSTDGAAAPVAASVYGGIGCSWGFINSFF
jgi:hypothetical protein